MSHDTGIVNPADDRIREILAGMRRVAVVGLSDKEDRASYGIARFLVGRDLEVIGVNPVLATSALGIPVYPSLSEVPGTVDVVDVFRRSDQVGPIAAEAVARGDACLWLQEEVVNEEAAAAARAGGLDVIMDRCLYKEWLRLMNG